MPKGHSVFKPGNGVCVKTLICGKVLSGETRFVEKLRSMHAKKCEACRNCESMSTQVGLVAPEMNRTAIVARTVAGQKIKMIN